MTVREVRTAALVEPRYGIVLPAARSALRLP